jgi:hypothetical protein
MVVVPYDVELMMMINEIDYVDDELNLNERYFDEMIIDHHNNHFENDENSPMIKNILYYIEET